MIKRLIIENFGPAPNLQFEFGERLNLITGDNGLGKTFLLDLAWFALTRTWPGDKEIKPLKDYPGTPKLRYHVVGRSGPNQEVEVEFNVPEQRWMLPQRRPPMPGLVIYARIDGGFSVWDPARNYWRMSSESPARDLERPSKFDFNRQQVWDGVSFAEGGATLSNGKDRRVLCRGLIEDWNTWQSRVPEYFELLSNVLETLSPPHRRERLRPGPSRRVDLFDSREFPTLDLGYAGVPITQISAGMQRVLSLAYMLVWAWGEHLRACKEFSVGQAQRVILLMDEVEAHLHPQWQRSLLPALLSVIAGKPRVRSTPPDSTDAVSRSHFSIKGKALFKGTTPQIIATTHAPLVCASVETSFDVAKDRLFHFKLTGQREVELEALEWAKQGDVGSWLVSEIFGLHQARSKEAEQAIEAAEAWMRGDRNGLPEGLQTGQEIDRRLHQVLPGHDRFWPRWIVKSGAHDENVSDEEESA